MARSKKAQAAIEDALSLRYSTGKVGLGVDLVEIDRMRRILSRTQTFKEKMFSEGERNYCDKKADPAVHYAARFAAKEAVVKALGCGFANGIGVLDIEVVLNDAGKPEIVLSGCALNVANDLGIIDIPVSLSHTKRDAIACAIAITEKSQEAKEAKRDPARELAQKFKETKAILDELN